jgi:hypothetical protein
LKKHQLLPLPVNSSIICSNARTQHDGRRFKASNRREEENAKERDEGFVLAPHGNGKLKRVGSGRRFIFRPVWMGNSKGNPRENVDKLELVFRNIPRHIRINQKAP